MYCPDPPDRPGIVIATRNIGKAREIRQVLAPLGVTLRTLDEVDPDRTIPEPSETGRTFAENARLKADAYACATGSWALADDSGLVVDALGGDPGVRSARYAAGETPPAVTKREIDAANNDRLLRELADVPEDRRTARFVCAVALAGDGRILLEARGEVAGAIAREPAGENGFGYDPLFVIPRLGRTAAELPAEEKNRISHRGRAVRSFAEKLAALLESSTT
jgi:XTP/dITP diphosphohydrolase